MWCCGACGRFLSGLRQCVSSRADEKTYTHIEPLYMSGVVMPELLEPIRYTLRFLAPHTHYVEVEAELPTGGKPWIELAMAVWTPGSYLIREYARHVEGLMARTPDGTELSLDKVRK